MDLIARDGGIPGLCVPASWTRAERMAVLLAGARSDADWCRRHVPCRPARTESVAAYALRVAQGAGYVPDPVECPTDWYQRADVTLRHGGDCDDLARLLVALGYAWGVRARLVVLPFPERPQDHLTVQLWHCGAWQWAEPSLPGARLGEAPEAAAARLEVSAPDAGGGPHAPPGPDGLRLPPESLAPARA
ncbi:MAG TPA: hypothetical protein VHH11_14125, partial [Gammaproteobacteria bacterium]|nr:hypothetical protein [Gammaproteobacteria bacterium]